MEPWPTQGNVAIEKMSDGRIVYNGKGEVGEIQYNLITVPKGSQIASIELADGSKVFLNSASSLKYLVAFKGSERRVEITGEVYFEIMKDPKRKFIVVSGDVQTEVLGTHFNVNAYADEEATKVTLVEGSVKVSFGDDNVIIKPGQQAEAIKNEKLKTNKNVDLSQIIAWKKGVFVFSQMDLKSILKQVSRWYDVTIEYKDSMVAGTFSGGLSRQLPLSEVIKILESNGIRCFVQGKKLIIGK